jgi:ABC-type nitrate/sulfonate/bicarbonate transport system substrate-binding protein
MLSRNPLGRLLLATFLALLPAALRAQAPPRLDFAGSVTWIGQVPILVALEKGFFKEQGLDVRLQVIVNSADRVRAIAAGSAAFSNLGRPAVLAEMARGNDSFIFFGNVDDAPGQEGCWARPGINSIAELRGKSVAANASAEVTLMGLLAESSMTLKDLDYRSLQGTEMAPALSHGDIQAACVWQPLLGRLKQAVPDGKLLGTDKDTAIFRRFGTMAAPDVLIMSRKLAETQPAQARALAIAIFKGADLTIAQPEEAAAAVASYFRQTPEQLLPAIRGFQFYGSADWQAHMQRHREQMQFLARLLHEAGRLPTLPETDRWANTSFVPDGKP